MRVSVSSWKNAIYTLLLICNTWISSNLHLCLFTPNNKHTNQYSIVSTKSNILYTNTLYCMFSADRSAEAKITFWEEYKEGFYPYLFYRVRTVHYYCYGNNRKIIQRWLLFEIISVLYPINIPHRAIECLLVYYRWNYFFITTTI